MTPGRLCIRGGRVVDPAVGLDARRDLLVADGRIAAVGEPGTAKVRPRADDARIDAAGCLVLPGLVDMHVHLRQPGMEEAEDVASGTRAAAAGGFTTVVCMPNTNPVIDRPARLARLLHTIRHQAVVRVLVAAALSEELAGRRVSDIAELARLGAAAVTDDGLGTRDTRVLGEALERAGRAGLAVLCHCEDRELSAGGVVTRGPVARRLGLFGITAEAERAATERAVGACRRHGGRLHVQHVSTRGALGCVRRARRAGAAVSCEVTPHHLFLTADDVADSAARLGAPDPRLKMNPPLRSRRDRDALREALGNETVDAIASDHAPHTSAVKARGFAAAPFGVTGLETTLPLVLRLVEEKVVTLRRAVALVTTGPAGVLGLPAPTLRPGAAADLVVVDPEATWRVDPEGMVSRSSNTAFGGWTMRGRVRYTLVNGRNVFAWRRH